MSADVSQDSSTVKEETVGDGVSEQAAISNAPGGADAENGNKFQLAIAAWRSASPSDT